MTEEIENKNNKAGNLGLILNVIILIGLIVLYVLFFTKKEKPEGDTQVQYVPAVSSGSGSIAFVNSDLVLEKYELVNKLTGQLEREQQKKDASFIAKQNALEADAAYFQEQVEKQSISQENAQQIYEQLMMKQQELYELQDKYATELAKKEIEMNVVLLDSVRNYLDRVNKIYNFDYILSYNAAGNILLAKDTFDITQQIIDGLNREYKIKYSPEK
ncbi:MAG: OmpH family outer membrane protein [Bacteroidetes bacterium]|nr:OmpH family outer membrane protein [Bacteroidota bacterium]MBL7104542.1 OmpH family outer membrane protein [Bacteroidales bacterium]